jgi:hypothetical protein
MLFMFRYIAFSTLASVAMMAQPFTDGFEGSAIDPAWALEQQSGSISLSTQQAHSGSQSLRFASEALGLQRSIVARRFLPVSSKGQFTAYFYDSSPGNETLYMYFWLFNAATPQQYARIGVDDYDGQCYKANIVNAQGVEQGPSTNCPGGFRPDQNTTAIPRTAGWHRFDIDVQATTVALRIDGNTVLNFSGDLSFDTIALSISGPLWRPNVVAYFDDVSLTPLAPSYAVHALYDSTRAVKSGATIPIKLQVHDSAGTNLSSSSLAVHATGLIQESTETTEVVQDAGNANPDSDFRYDAELGGTGGYIFNLKTTGLASGTYRLQFRIGASPTTFSVPFQVK